MMSKTEFKMHLNRISDLAHEVRFYTERMTENDFRKDEDIKERTYLSLQEIGQAASEINAQYEGDEKLEIPMIVISQLKNARYNQEAELNHQQVFGIIKNDLPQIKESVDKLLYILNLQELSEN